jgi:hypothetical protein
MKYLDAVRLLALKAVLKPDTEDHLRQIFRWYSKTFSTPLHVVEGLPLDNILRTYYEDMYGGLEDEQKEELLADLLLTDEERKKKDLKKDLDNFEMEVLSRIIREDAKKKAQKKMSEVDVSPPVTLGQVAMRPAESKLPAVGPVRTTLPESMTISFVDKELFRSEEHTSELQSLAD